MKRALLMVLLVSFAVTMTFAQGNNRQGKDSSHKGQRNFSQQRNHNRTPPPAPESISVSGNLTIAQGMIAVTSNDTTYLAGGLNRFVGFIDGLKEGAAVTLEGFTRPVPRSENVKFMMVQKMSLNGKDYDLAMPRMNIQPRQNMQQQNMQPRQHPRQNINPRQMENLRNNNQMRNRGK